jgi:hypothetical protein
MTVGFPPNFKTRHAAKKTAWFATALLQNSRLNDTV